MPPGIGAREHLDPYVCEAGGAHRPVELATDERRFVGEARGGKKLRDALGAERLDGEHSPIAVDDVESASRPEHAPELDERRVQVRLHIIDSDWGMLAVE